jgi:transposase
MERMKASASATAATSLKRRRRTKQERRRIVEETLAPGASVARVARAHEVNANQVFYWRKLYREGRLSSAVETTALVPVRLCESVRTQPAVPAASVAVPRRQGSSHGGGRGTIQIEMERARVRIDGAPEPAALRIVLECLLG